MNQLYLGYLILFVSLSSLSLTAILLYRFRQDHARDLERCLREELSAAREEQAAAARDLRAELTQAGRATTGTVVKLLGELRESQATQLGVLSGTFGKRSRSSAPCSNVPPSRTWPRVRHSARM